MKMYRKFAGTLGLTMLLFSICDFETVAADIPNETTFAQANAKILENLPVSNTIPRHSVLETVKESDSESAIEESVNEEPGTPEESSYPETENESEPAIEKEQEVAISLAHEKVVDESDHIYSYDEMEKDIIMLAEAYPEHIEVDAVGTSVDGRKIYQIVIGKKDAPHAIYVQSTIHAREWMNTWVLMASLEENLSQWDNEYLEEKTRGSIFENCCVYLLPMVNPDGVCISQLGIESLKNEKLREACKQMPGASNPSKWKANANGVDLNRQFSIGFNNMINAKEPSSEFYNGEEPFSEPEAVAVKNALEQRDFDAAVSYHSVEGAIYWNLGQSGELKEQTKELAKLIRDETGYHMIESQSSLKGLDYNYMAFEKNLPAVVVETGRVPAPLPYSEYDDLRKENGNILITLSNYYGNK